MMNGALRGTPRSSPRVYKVLRGVAPFLLPLVFLACAAGRPSGPSPTPAADGRSLPADADNGALAVAALLTPPFCECPDRVWPGFPGREIQVLLADFRGRRALLWNDLRDGFRDIPRLTAIPFGELPPLFTSGSEYQFGVLYGKPTLGFAYDPKADPSWSTEVVAHEAFHRYVQRNWKGAGESMERGIRYPEPWGPRYLRRELIRSLRGAVRVGEGFVRDDGFRNPPGGRQGRPFFRPRLHCDV